MLFGLASPLPNVGEGQGEGEKRKNYVMKQNKPFLTTSARTLRKRSTAPEQHLWRALRARRLGFKFRRQVPLCGYVVDFVCFEAKLVVELDGSQHASKGVQAADRVRDARLEEAGFQVMRFWNHEIYEDMETVLEQIYAMCIRE